MEKFDELQNLWSGQRIAAPTVTPSELIKKAETNLVKLKRGQRWTVGILSTLTAILLGYFVWVGAHRHNALTLGLGVMIGVILIRIALECISVFRLKRIRLDITMTEFGEQMTRFYIWRRKIHIVMVPLIYLLYTGGFIMLLPAFKENLSAGMYWYIVISGFGSLTALAFFLARQIRKETKLLRVLKSV